MSTTNVQRYTAVWVKSTVITYQL